MFLIDLVIRIFTRQPACRFTRYYQLKCLYDMIVQINYDVGFYLLLSVFYVGVKQF